METFTFLFTDIEGDAFFAVFSSPRSCLAATMEILGHEQTAEAYARGLALGLEDALDLARK